MARVVEIIPQGRPEPVALAYSKNGCWCAKEFIGTWWDNVNIKYLMEKIPFIIIYLLCYIWFIWLLLIIHITNCFIWWVFSSDKLALQQHTLSPHPTWPGERHTNPLIAKPLQDLWVLNEFKLAGLRQPQVRETDGGTTHTGLQGIILCVLPPPGSSSCFGNWNPRLEDSTVGSSGLSADIHSAGDSVSETLGSNPAFSRGRTLVSFGLDITYLLPVHQTHLGSDTPPPPPPPLPPPIPHPPGGGGSWGGGGGVLHWTKIFDGGVPLVNAKTHPSLRETNGPDKPHV